MKSICVFGVFVADLCFVADAIPEKGQTILGNKHIVGPGGKGSNQAIAAARLGGKVNFITKVGNDQNANMALNLYKEVGINTDSIIQDENQLTGVAGIMINEKTGDNAINIVPGAAGSLTNKDIDKNISFIENSEIFLTQLETPYEVTSYALQKAKETGSITIFNPAPASYINESDFKCMDYFTPNETEASFYLKKNVESKTEIEEAAKNFLNKGVKNIIITLGSKGVYFSSSSESYFLDAFNLKDKVIDTTGAGDAFNGAFAYALSKNNKDKDALEFANKVAGISTTRVGAANAMPKLEEVEDY
ncbi:ribokinase [Candidatus Pelagibacter sp.]|nr:ribokinase [Candidatus Pelagibacter sp.]